MPADDALLETALSEPTPAVTDALSSIAGDLVVLGVGGKMGPTLARLARRAFDSAGRPSRVIGVARFTDPDVRRRLDEAGVETVEADLLDRSAVTALPDAANVVFMAGQKFGTTTDSPRTWAMNAYVPALVAERYQTARIVVFSTGNVYPLWRIERAGPTEADPVAPIGEYAQSVLGRERLFEFFSRRFATPGVTLRINYAVEPRYGVLRDIADRVWNGQPVDVTMGWVNVIWQADANALALRALTRCETPPLVLNVTGPKLAVREIARRFASRWGKSPVFAGREAETALLSNPARCDTLFGPPPTDLDTMIEWVGRWIEAGGRALGKPTHFEERRGAF